MAHHGFCLDMEISEHLVGLPASEQTDPICVDVGAEKGHGASGAEGAGRDIRGSKTVGRSQDRDRETQQGGDVGRCETTQSRSDGIDIGGEGLCWSCCSEPEMEDAAG